MWTQYKHKNYLIVGSFQKANQWLLFEECVCGSRSCQQLDGSSCPNWGREAPTLRVARICRQVHCQYEKWLPIIYSEFKVAWFHEAGLMINIWSDGRYTRCIICHIAHRSWQYFKMKLLCRYGRELCYTLKINTNFVCLTRRGFF